MKDQAERAALVAAAHHSIVLGSRSFAMASRLFDRRTRERVWLLYAWCRAADDIADGQQLGMARIPVENPQAALDLIRGRTAAALAGEPIDDPAFAALAVVLDECRIPKSLPADVIKGFAMDASGFVPRSEEDLLRYCYHVAGAVGVMMAIVMGVDPADDATLDRACDLGIAFQLTNIARDIVEDAEAGRCYLPASWLAEFGLERETIGAPGGRLAMAAIAQRLAQLVKAYEASARVGAVSLDWRSRWAVLAAAGIYSGIARKVADAGIEAWDRRVITSSWRKTWELGRALWNTTLRPRPIGRDGLWTRDCFT